MLKDRTRSEDFRTSKHWKSPLMKFDIWVPQKDSSGKETFKSNSFSGNERNRLYFGGVNGFTQRTLVSGADCREDARSFALLDFDQDGWLDFALASLNGQRLRLFRNRLADLGASGRAIEVSLSGGNHTAQVGLETSNRDAIGAVLTTVSNHRTRVFRKSLGEGLAAQNSGSIRVTLAEGEQLQKLSVRWPSGKVTTLGDIPDQAELTLAE